MRTTYALFALLPLAMGVGCVGCEIPNDDTDDTIANDTGDTEDPDGYNVVFNFDPVSGTPLVVTAQGDEDESCTAPCSIVVHKTGDWFITAQDDVFWFISWSRKLENKDDDATFTYQWDEDYAYGVKIEESVYIDPDEDEHTIYTEIRSGDEIPSLGHDFVALQGLPVGGIPVTGYTFELSDGGINLWTGYMQEDLEILHIEIWDIESEELLEEEDWRRVR